MAGKTQKKQTKKTESKTAKANSTKGKAVNKLEDEKKLIFERLAPMRDQRTLLSEISQKRDKLNDKVKEISEKVRALKSTRDDLNEKVQAEKRKRDDINKGAKDLRKGFKTSFGQTAPKRGSSDLQILRKKAKNLSWEIQTSGFSFKEEKKKQKQLDDVEKQLKKLEKYDNSRLEIVKKDKEARTFHSNVMDYSKQSEKVHQDLVLLYEQLREARQKADEKHNKVVEAIEELKKMEIDHSTDLKRFAELHGEIKGTRDSAEKQKHIDSLKTAQVRGAEAFAEFTKGGRVDLRDLQLKFLGKDKKNSKKRK